MTTQTEQSTLGELYNPLCFSAWQPTPLYSLADWINGLAFKDIHFTKTGKPVIKIAEIKNGVTGQTQFTDGSYDSNIHIADGDMLFAWSGQPETSIGVSIWRGQDGWLNQHIFKVLPNATVDRDFFFFLLRYLNPYFVRIAKNKQTTGLGHVTKEDLRSMQVGIPPLDGQRKITQVLLPLERKIELLRRQNETLEQIAQAIFNEWFVRPTADGSLPDGWRMGTMADLCAKVASGGTPSTRNNDYYGGSIQWFSTKELNDNFLFESEKKITEAGLNGSAAKLFPAGTVVMAIYAAPTVGRLGILSREATFNQATVGLISNEASSTEFVYLYLQHERDTLNNLANGAAQQNLSVGLVRTYPVVMPDSITMEQLNAAIKPLFRKVLNNTEEMRTLAVTRDALLPRLMSGEIRV